VGDVPAFGLLYFVAAPASGVGVAGAGLSALVIGGGVLEVRFTGMPGAGGEGAFAVADLDQVAEGVVGLVGMRLMAVVAFGDVNK
jgi:hypothetical protein